MKKLLLGFCALALGTAVVAGCSESRTDRVGERPGDRTPAASPPTTPPPSDTTTTPSTPTTPPASQPTPPSETEKK